MLRDASISDSQCIVSQSWKFLNSCMVDLLLVQFIFIQSFRPIFVFSSNPNLIGLDKNAMDEKALDEKWVKNSCKCICQYALKNIQRPLAEEYPMIPGCSFTSVLIVSSKTWWKNTQIISVRKYYFWRQLMLSISFLSFSHVVHFFFWRQLMLSISKPINV